MIRQDLHPFERIANLMGTAKQVLVRDATITSAENTTSSSRPALSTR